MQRVLNVIIVSITAGIIIGAFYSNRESAAQPQQKTTEVPACVVDFLPYSDVMKSQIMTLCNDGLSFNEALNALRAVYNRPDVNPDAAVQIISKERDLGPWRGAVADPDPWRKR